MKDGSEEDAVTQRGRRRALFTFSAAMSAFLVRTGARAQVPGKTYRLGVLRQEIHRSFPRGRLPPAMEQELAQHGFVVGQNLRVEEVVEAQVADGRHMAARELVGLNPDVILVRWADRVMLLGSYTQTIPIVFFDVGNQIKRPPNSTGVVFLRQEIMEKKLEIIRELLPGIKEVGLVANFGYMRRLTPGYPAAFGKPAERISLRLVEANLDLNDNNLDATLADLKARGVRAFIHDGVFPDIRSMDALARKHRLVLVGSGGATHGVASIEVDWDDHLRRAAWILAKVLKGSNPAELPVDGDRRLVISLKPALANELGVEIPASLRIRAERIVNE